MLGLCSPVIPRFRAALAEETLLIPEYPPRSVPLDEYPTEVDRERRAAEALRLVRAALGEEAGNREARLAELIGLLVATDPDRREQREAWVTRGEEITALRRAVASYAVPMTRVVAIRNALCGFADLEAAERLLNALKAELDWREKVEQQEFGLPPETTEHWWPFRERGHPPGRPATRRRVAEKAIEFGLRPEHVAMLESCLRVPLPEWPIRGELLSKDTLFLSPHPKRRHADPLRDPRIHDRWCKVFESVRSAARPRQPKGARRGKIETR